MHPVYHAKITVSTKNFPWSEGRKCGEKGLVQCRSLMVWSISWFRVTGKGALHSQECFLPPRGGFNLRCTRERYIPKNVFFLREKVLIYDAPSLPRKNNRFDQELPLVRGSKVWRKGSRPVA
jgi:hypothetical protein